MQKRDCYFRILLAHPNISQTTLRANDFPAESLVNAQHVERMGANASLIVDDWVLEFLISSKPEKNTLSWEWSGINDSELRWLVRRNNKPTGNQKIKGNMEVSWNRGTPKSSILKGFPLKINHFGVSTWLWNPPYWCLDTSQFPTKLWKSLVNKSPLKLSHKIV